MNGVHRVASYRRMTILVSRTRYGTTGGVVDASPSDGRDPTRLQRSPLGASVNRFLAVAIRRVVLGVRRGGGALAESVADRVPPLAERR